MAGKSSSAYRSVGVCPATGKQQFVSKRGAKMMRRVLRGESLAVYECQFCEYWHLGHLPAAIISGELGRDIYRNHATIYDYRRSEESEE